MRFASHLICSFVNYKLFYKDMGKDKKIKEATIQPSSEGPRCDAAAWPLLLKVRS